jgi:hypothetical protein
LRTPIEHHDEDEGEVDDGKDKTDMIEGNGKNASTVRRALQNSNLLF